MANLDDLLSELADIGNSPPAKSNQSAYSQPLQASHTSSGQTAIGRVNAATTVGHSGVSFSADNHWTTQQASATASTCAVDDLLSMLGDVGGSSQAHHGSTGGASSAVHQDRHESTAALLSVKSTAAKTKCAPVNCIQMPGCLDIVSCADACACMWAMLPPQKGEAQLPDPSQ